MPPSGDTAMAVTSQLPRGAGTPDQVQPSRVKRRPSKVVAQIVPLAVSS
ncbi:MAG: hypothetical protein HS111_10955 [Kofleriaceae bacterium]|nr:hypothetical protein [Kofleriaceae bacterium]